MQISIDNVMPDDVSKKSLKVLDKKLQLLSKHALFHVNINSVVGGGIRNPVGLAWNPEDRRLWATVQERDGLGDDLVPDFFTSVREGAYYGWPYAYIGPHEEPRNKGQRPDLVAKTIVPDVLLTPSHVAAMDVRFYTGRQFPARYRNGAFIAFRGSSNRAERTGYSVVFIPFKNGKPAGPQEDFLTGFMLDPNNKEVWAGPWVSPSAKTAPFLCPRTAATSCI